MKRILSVLLALVMVIGMFPMGILSASAAEQSATLSFADKANRTVFTTSQQVWVQNGITLTNDKASSTNNVADYANPARFYAKSSITIAVAEGNNITKIEFTANSSSYATALMNSAGAEATASGSVVTIIPAAKASSYEIASMTAQVRANSVTVYYEASTGACAHTATTEVAAVAATCTGVGYTAGMQCNECLVFVEGHEVIPALGHDWSDWAQTTAPGCVTEGVETSTCANCGETKTQAIAATGHTYVDGVCSGCGKTQGTAVATQITTAEQFVSGEYVLVVSSGAAMGALDGSWVTAVQPEILDGAVLDAANGVWTLTVNGSSVTIQDANGVFIAPKTGNDNGIIESEYSWAWSVNEDGTFVFAGTGEDTTKLASNTGSENKFRAYKNATVAGNTTNYLANFAVYKMNEGGEVEPDPEEPTCEHTNTTTTTVDATCTENGSTTVTCNDCGETVSTEVIEATGHSYAEGVCSVCGEAEPEEPDVPTSSEATITFDDTSKRTTLTVTQQVWTENGVTVTNDKASSTTNIANYSKPARFYKGSTVTVAYTGMTKIVFNCNTADYATALAASITNATVSVSEKVVTVVLDAAADTFTTGGMSAQVRVDSITVYASSCEHVWGEMVQTSAPTCTETGVNTSTCSLCGETKTETVAATGHSYTYVDGAMTCTCGDSKTISPIADAKAYTSTSQVYYIKGIVTYVNGRDIYMEDATGGILVYGTSNFEGINIGDELVVWDTITTYQGKIETSGTSTGEYMVVSTGNDLPAVTVTIDALTAADHYGKRVIIENVTMGVMGTNNTALTDAAGNSINIYKLSGQAEAINENDTVTVTAIVSAYNTTLQLVIDPDTAATDIVEIKDGTVEEITTITIAEAKAGTAGEYYQVEGVVTFIDGRNVYIQDATGGIVVYLTADAATTQVGDTVKAYGALKVYNGLIELDAVDETNAEFYSILSNGNTVDAQAVTIADLTADTTNEYLAEKITLNNVYVSYSYDYSSSYANVTYVLKDGENTITIYRAPAASEADVLAGGTIINVEAIVSSHNGYQLRIVGIESITVVGACAHETTNLVNVTAATCTEAGYTGDTECAACGNYTVRGEEIEALGHNFNAGGVCANNCGIVNVAVIDGTFYTTFADAYAAATEGQTIKLLANAGEDSAVELTKDLYVDLNGFFMTASAAEGTAYTVYGMDSCTDSYEADEWGYLTVTGATVAPLYNSYLAVDEGNLGWSFHAYSAKLTFVSLDPTNDALGYKAQFYGDEMVLDHVTGFGYNLWVNEDMVVTKGYETAFTNGQIVTLRLKGIMAADGGEMEIFANAYVTFDTVDGQVTSKNYSTTMRETIEKIEANVEANVNAYSEAQMIAIQGLIATYESKMEGWNIDAIKAWGAEV